METHFFFEIAIVLLVKQKLMLGMWKPTPNGDILLQQITNSHGEGGMHPSDEACLRIANVGQAMKEGLVRNTVLTPPIIRAGHPP